MTPRRDMKKQNEVQRTREEAMRREQVRTMRLGVGGVSLLLAITLGALAASGSTSPPARHAGVVTITYRDKGSIVDVAAGQKIRVVLDSTYWTINQASNAGVVARLGAEHVLPRGGCVPGEGCGTATSWFRAVGSGRVVITASRVSCGEALRCTNGNGSFRVTVRVS